MVEIEFMMMMMTTTTTMMTTMMKNTFPRCNMLTARFNKCSHFANCILFNTYRLCLYIDRSWKNYTVTVEEV